MQFNIIFKTIFEYFHQIFRFMHTNTFCKYRKNYSHRLACILFNNSVQWALWRTPENYIALSMMLWLHVARWFSENIRDLNICSELPWVIILITLSVTTFKLNKSLLLLHNFPFPYQCCTIFIDTLPLSFTSVIWQAHCGIYLRCRSNHHTWCGKYNRSFITISLLTYLITAMWAI